MAFHRLPLCLLIWSAVCALAALPSWVLANEYSAQGRVLGIACWVIIYASVSSTDAFVRRWRIPFERRAIVVTYGIRIAIGPLSMLLPMLMTVDMILGIVATGMGKQLLGFERPSSVVGTCIITIIQGGFLSVLTFGALLVIRLICRGAMPPHIDSVRGFEVMSVQPMEEAK